MYTALPGTWYIPGTHLVLFIKQHYFEENLIDLIGSVSRGTLSQEEQADVKGRFATTPESLKYPY